MDHCLIVCCQVGDLRQRNWPSCMIGTSKVRPGFNTIPHPQGLSLPDNTPYSKYHTVTIHVYLTSSQHVQHTGS